MWFQTWVEKRYIINSLPQNSNILYTCKLMQLSCNIFELCLQMTITCIYFCLLFLPEAQKYLHLSDQIFYTNRKSEKVKERKKWDEIFSKWCRFIVLRNYAVLPCTLLLKRQVFLLIYWNGSTGFGVVCVCARVHACVYGFHQKNCSFLSSEKKWSKRSLFYVAPTPLNFFHSPVEVIIPVPRENEETGLLPSSSVSNGWKTCFLSLITK